MDHGEILCQDQSRELEKHRWPKKFTKILRTVCFKCNLRVKVFITIWNSNNRVCYGLIFSNVCMYVYIYI